MHAAVAAPRLRGGSGLGAPDLGGSQELPRLALLDALADRCGGLHRRRASGPSCAQDARPLPQAPADAIERLRRDFADRLEPVASAYGMHVAAYARDGRDLEAVAARLAGQGVKIHTLQRYYLGVPGRRGLVFGYGAVDPDEIARGLDLLGKAMVA